MQATQSRTASGTRNISGQFAALRDISRNLSNGFDERTRGCRPVAKAVRVAEGAGLAHDAGNLLGALGLYSELLAMPGVLYDEHREYAAELRLLTERSWVMIDRLVNYAGTVEESGATVLPEVLERCRGLLSKVAGRGVEITWNAGSFRPVEVTSEAVERIVTNLVKNAAEATPGESAIGVSLSGEGERGARRVVMTVADAGCGMSRETVTTLEQDRGRSTAETPEGRPARRRGLGFRVVRELVATSGGCLSISSEVGVGTRISVAWPVAIETGSVITTEREMKRALKGEAGWTAC